MTTTGVHPHQPHPHARPPARSAVAGALLPRCTLALHLFSCVCRTGAAAEASGPHAPGLQPAPLTCAWQRQRALASTLQGHLPRPYAGCGIEELEGRVRVVHGDAEAEQGGPEAPLPRVPRFPRAIPCPDAPLGQEYMRRWSMGLTGRHTVAKPAFPDGYEYGGGGRRDLAPTRPSPRLTARPTDSGVRTTRSLHPQCQVQHRMQAVPPASSCSWRQRQPLPPS